MANRFRKLFESIVYAGMKPETRASQTEPAGKPGLLARFLSGPVPSDPLYLTNQTFGQKARRFLVLVVPLVVVVALVVVAIAILLPKKAFKEPATVVAPRVLPNIKDIKLGSNPDLEVVDVHFDHTGGDTMLGAIRNKTDRQINEAVVVMDLVDDDRSQLGGITVTENNLAPGETRTFKMPIEQSTASLAVVREVHTK